jgi:hypothetical protein
VSHWPARTQEEARVFPFQPGFSFQKGAGQLGVGLAALASYLSIHIVSKPDQRRWLGWTKYPISRSQDPFP